MKRSPLLLKWLCSGLLVCLIGGARAEIVPLYFKDGGSSSKPVKNVVDAWPGVSESGWASAWTRRGNKAVEYDIKVASGQPLTPEHNTYLNITLTKPDTAGETNQQSVYRTYNVSSLGGDHTVSFLFRLNSEEGTQERLVFSDVDSKTAPDAKISWTIRSLKGTWRVFNKKWQDTGVPVQQGHVYRFTVRVVGNQYEVSIEDLTDSSSYQTPALLPFRDATTPGGTLAFTFMPKKPTEGESPTVLDCSLGAITVTAQ